jgi:hypothetical protein
MPSTGEPLGRGRALALAAPPVLVLDVVVVVGVVGLLVVGEA